MLLKVQGRSTFADYSAVESTHDGPAEVHRQLQTHLDLIQRWLNQ